MTRFTPSASLIATNLAHRVPEPWLDKLDPEWAKIWNTHGGHHCQAEEVSIEEVRKDPAAYSFTYPIWDGKYRSCSVYNVSAEDSAGPQVHLEKEFCIPVTKPAGQIKVRVYTPEGDGPFPVHFNYHGGKFCTSLGSGHVTKLRIGGWILGGLKSEAAWCRSVCNKTGIVIIDVDYRLAPEFVFPAAIYDSWDAIQWASPLCMMHILLMKLTSSRSYLRDTYSTSTRNEYR